MASVYTRILKQYIPPIHPLTFRIFLLVQFPSTRYINRASTWLVPRRHLPPLSALNVLLSSNNPTPNAFPALKLADREIFNAKPLIGGNDRRGCSATACGQVREYSEPAGFEGSVGYGFRSD